MFKPIKHALLQKEPLILRSSRPYHAMSGAGPGGPGGPGGHSRFDDLKRGHTWSVYQTKGSPRDYMRIKGAQVLARDTRAMTLMIRPPLKITRITLGGSISGERDYGKESPH
jgi:hypothetical protein